MRKCERYREDGEWLGVTTSLSERLRVRVYSRAEDGADRGQLMRYN